MDPGGSTKNTFPNDKANSDSGEMSARNTDGVSTCCVRRQSVPCCGQTHLKLNEFGNHDKLVRPIKGPIEKAWGLSPVYVTCCGVVHGMYYDVNTSKHDFMFLGNDEKQALLRANQVKSFFAN